MFRNQIFPLILFGTFLIVIVLSSGCIQPMIQEESDKVIEGAANLSGYDTAGHPITIENDKSYVKIHCEVPEDYLIKNEIVDEWNDMQKSKGNNYTAIFHYYWSQIQSESGAIKVYLPFRGTYHVLFTNVNNTDVHIEFSITIYEPNG